MVGELLSADGCLSILGFVDAGKLPTSHLMVLYLCAWSVLNELRGLLITQKRSYKV